MGMVFIFLTILYFVVLFMGKIMGFLDKIMPAEPVAVASTGAGGSSSDVEVAIAIAAAKSKLGK